MQAVSRGVTSNQQHIHPGLPTLLRRHRANSYRKPVAQHNRQSFEGLRKLLARTPRRLVLDSFCGTGHSTAALALRHPKHLVVGIDKSCHRLAKHPGEVDANSILLHAECEDIWRLLRQEGFTVDYHYLLYPNPWPKAAHLKRRIHGHPAFRYLLELGGRVELRSNWQIYVEEIGVAMHLAGQCGRVLQLEPDVPLTLFEQKYQASGHPLWGYVGRVYTAEPPR